MLSNRLSPSTRCRQNCVSNFRIDETSAAFQKNGTLGTLQRFRKTCSIWNSRKTTQYTNVTLGTLVRNHQNILMRHNKMSTTRKEKVCIRPKLGYSEEDKDNYHRDSINIHSQRQGMNQTLLTPSSLIDWLLETPLARL